MKKVDIKPTFTSREMNAIVSILLSNNGVNVDPIIKDLYPNVGEETISIFRCKMALLLSGKLPEFSTYEGFAMDSSYKCFKLKCIAESSLLGISTFEIMEVWRKSSDNQWMLDTTDKSVGECRMDNLELYPSIEEAKKHW